MASVLTCLLGFDRLDVAEDIVQDAMMLALRSWPGQGIPDNPRAWLYRVAKNKALDWLRREKHTRHLHTELIHQTENEPDEQVMERVFFEDEIADSQLRMLFACCHPALGFESQVALCLKLLCGLSVREIAGAFLSSPDTIEKRLYRAKERIRSDEIRLVVPTGPQLPARLDAVLTSIYLLFNEGYTSSHPDMLIRQELCEEAMRLCLLLTQHPAINHPPVSALMSLLCFQAARFEARTDTLGDMVLLPNQDRSRWNTGLIRQGEMFLNRAAVGAVASRYHLEAAIAAHHCTAPTYETTDWAAILTCYDHLSGQYPSPIVALHRAVAVAQVDGPAQALAEVTNLTGLDHNQYYHAVLGDLYRRNQQPEPARQHYRRAIQLTPSTAERKLLAQTLQNL